LVRNNSLGFPPQWEGVLLSLVLAAAPPFSYEKKWEKVEQIGVG